LTGLNNATSQERRGGGRRENRGNRERKETRAGGKKFHQDKEKPVTLYCALRGSGGSDEEDKTGGEGERTDRCIKEIAGRQSK